MAFDAHKNFAIATVAGAPGPPTSGVFLTVAAGQGAIFPAAPFNATVWPSGQMPTPATAEIVRVTAKSGDLFTITRTQEGSTARAIVIGDLIAATITAKTITDLESGTNFPLISTGAGTFSSTVTAGANIALTTNATIGRTTADGADTGYLQISGGGGVGPTSARGAVINLTGNEAAGLGVLDIVAGNTASGKINFYTANTALRWTIDAAEGAFRAGTEAVGQQFCTLAKDNGQLRSGTSGTGAYNHVLFYNPNGFIGWIQTSGSTTTYNTASDARLKRDRGAHTDLDVLRRTVIHAFDWIEDGTPGRGVFAQEAITVAPFAVTPGTDDRDAEGRLTTPWGVDYAKYVPDLVVGWQAHEARCAALEARCAALEARLAALTLPPNKD